MENNPYQSPRPEARLHEVDEEHPEVIDLTEPPATFFEKLVCVVGWTVAGGVLAGGPSVPLLAGWQDQFGVVLTGLLWQLVVILGGAIGLTVGVARLRESSKP